MNDKQTQWASISATHEYNLKQGRRYSPLYEKYEDTLNIKGKSIKLSFEENENP